MMYLGVKTTLYIIAALREQPFHPGSHDSEDRRRLCHSAICGQRWRHQAAGEPTVPDQRGCGGQFAKKDKTAVPAALSFDLFF